MASQYTEFESVLSKGIKKQTNWRLSDKCVIQIVTNGRTQNKMYVCVTEIVTNGGTQNEMYVNDNAGWHSLALAGWQV